MKTAIKRLNLLVVAAFLAVASVILIPKTPTATALSACPTDPLSSYSPYSGNYNDSNAVNVGVKFNVNGAPHVTGVKFYKSLDNTGTHVAHLREAGGTVDLASATFTSETSFGWQTVYFDTPVPVKPGWDTQYVVWVSMPNGHYAVDGVDAGGTLHFNQPTSSVAFGDRYRDAVYIRSGESGLYSYTSDHTVMPTNAVTNNYWVSPIIDDSIAPGNVTGLTATDDQAGPLVEWTGSATDQNAATSTAPIVRTDFIRTEGSNSVTVGSQYGNLPFWSGALGEQHDVTASPGKNYTYTVKTYDGCGNASTGATANVTTASQSLSNIFSADPSSVDTYNSKVVVGMHWQTSTAGKVWGAKIYRAPGTMQTTEQATTDYRVTLWDNNGAVLAYTYLPRGIQQTGWIDVRFSEPVDVEANHDYVIGYFSPNGKISYTDHTHTSAATNGTLSARADSLSTPNGVYSQEPTVGYSTFPTYRSLNSTWYGVDVNFYIP